MTDIQIRDRTWSRLVTLADARGVSPAKMTELALSEFLDRQADEDLLRRSCAAAQRSKLTMAAADAAIRQLRIKRSAESQRG